jgi:hypothetical protein
MHKGHISFLDRENPSLLIHVEPRTHHRAVTSKLAESRSELNECRNYVTITALLKPGHTFIASRILECNLRAAHHVLFFEKLQQSFS